MSDKNIYTYNYYFAGQKIEINIFSETKEMADYVLSNIADLNKYKILEYER